MVIVRFIGTLDRMLYLVESIGLKEYFHRSLLLLLVMLNLRTPCLIGRIAIRNICFGFIIMVRLNAFLHDAFPIEEMNPAEVHCEMADVVIAGVMERLNMRIRPFVLLRYVKGTKDYGITYKHNGGNKIHGYNNSSYEVNTQEGKGTTGIIFYYGESPISLSTQKQATVALSLCESEFIAATAAATQALWLKRLLSKLTHSQEEKVTIQVDNKSAIALMKNPVFHGRSKHIDTKYHFIRECVKKEDIQVEFINGEYQKADILTKAPPKIKFLTMRQLIGLKDLRSVTSPLELVKEEWISTMIANSRETWICSAIVPGSVTSPLELVEEEWISTMIANSRETCVTSPLELVEEEWISTMIANSRETCADSINRAWEILDQIYGRGTAAYSHSQSSAKKAQDFLPFHQRNRRLTTVVEYVLCGHRCPGRDEPYSNDAISIIRHKIMQRDVEVVTGALYDEGAVKVHVADGFAAPTGSADSRVMGFGSVFLLSEAKGSEDVNSTTATPLAAATQHISNSRIIF
ncbi:ribonuclease H-like domain, reverse transcriptase, RNA-dependent DNA polymerase [Tanacetum coccineum]